MALLSSSSKDRAAENPIDKLISLATSLVDWAVLIVMLILPSILRNYRIIFGICFGIGVVITIYNYHRYRQGTIKVFPKVFEVGILLINLAILIFELAANPSYEWSYQWTNVITSACLLALTVFSIAINKPFTIEFAMEKVPEESWGTPMFHLVNQIISAVWALEFALSVMFSLLAIYVYPNNSVARIVPGIVVLVLALKFTKDFPVYMRRRALAGRVEEEQGNNNGSRPVVAIPLEV